MLSIYPVMLLTVHGEQKVRIMMKRGGGILQDHMDKMIEQSNLVDEESQEQEEKGQGHYNWPSPYTGFWMIFGKNSHLKNIL